MQVTFLGGAEEIGASCALLEIENGVRILVDCGQRLNVASGMELPDFSLLEEGPPIAAIVLTHAHTDHIGALPALEPFLSAECPIYGTEPTLELTRVMLNDTVRIMARHRQGDGQLPLFPAAALPRTLARLAPVRWGKAVRLAEEVRATWFPSGHLLGAGMIEIRGRKESVLFSGDVSVADQATVAGAFVPAVHPDLLVLESTYGNRLHAHRPTQERKIIERVGQCVASGGHVLFPTFALGRAQEVLVILGQAMRRGQLASFPVYADGLVREISKVYSRFPEELSAGCRQVHEQGLDPIFPEDFPLLPVRSNEKREKIARGEPCVVVSSSGMLQGGASQFYATHWISDPRNLILITGYQDEESPGEALLNLARLPEGEPRFFKLGGVRTAVHCEVEKFSLSAHADHVELVAIADKLQPKLTLLVHGDSAAREMLGNSLASAGRPGVVLPRNGETYSLASRGTRRAGMSLTQRLNPLALWPPWDPQLPRPLDLERFHTWLISLKPRLSWVTLEELAELWKSPEPVAPEDLEVLRKAIAAQAVHYFVPEARRPFLLHLTPPENLPRSDRPAPRMSMEQATQIAEELLLADEDIRRYGFYPAEGVLRLEVSFPTAAAENWSSRFADFHRRTGWQIVLNNSTADTELEELARELLRESSLSQLEISHSENEVRTSLGNAESAHDLERVAARFFQRTGYRLVIAHRGESIT